MDSYEEAAADFEQAYGEDATYDMAIRIYECLSGTGYGSRWNPTYLEAALSKTANNAQDHCDRGRVYYYMDDYDNAQTELSRRLQTMDNTEADGCSWEWFTWNRRIQPECQKQVLRNMYLRQRTVPKALMVWLCVILQDGDYDSALSNISSGISPFADGEELQSLLFNEMTVYEKKLDFATAIAEGRRVSGYCIRMIRRCKKELAFLKTRVSVTGTAGLSHRRVLWRNLEIRRTGDPGWRSDRRE